MRARALAVVLCLLAGPGLAAEEVRFTESETRAILAHGPWPTPITEDPSNRASGKRAAVELGERLFFDTRLSADGRFSCGTCHVPERNWTDNRVRGVAAAELAVCLPLVVLLVIASIEACSAIFLKQSLTVAAYEGVRAAVAPGGTSSSVQATCNQVLADRRVNGAAVTVSPSNISALAPGEYVNVTVTAPCSSNSLVPTSFYRGRSLSTTASMMIEH